MSDFFAARVHLEYAYDYLCGSDETSKRTREALDLLIEAVATMEFRRTQGQIIPFPDREMPVRRKSHK